MYVPQWQGPIGIFLTLLVTSETSRMIASNAALSCASFCLCSAILSLNFLGFAMMARHLRSPNTREYRAL